MFEEVTTLKREYETVVIIDSTADEAKTTERIDKFSAIVTAADGEIREVQKWGRRKLAYEINRRCDGIYVLIRFTADPVVLKEIDHRLKLDEMILRHMTVIQEADEPPPVIVEGMGSAVIIEN